jgi:hypothetical protein
MSRKWTKNREKASRKGTKMAKILQKKFFFGGFAACPPKEKESPAFAGFNFHSKANGTACQSSGKIIM